MRVRRVGNSSSKYDYEPHQIDADVENKLAVKAQFKADLKAVIHGDYHYQEGEGRMSYNAKRIALIEVVKEFIEMLEG